MIYLLELYMLGFAQSPQNAGRIGYCAGDDLMDEHVRAISGYRRPATAMN